MKKFAFLLFFLSTGLTGFSKIVVITNWGAHFSPADTTVNMGDTIKFDLMNTHNVLEVDQQAYDDEQNIPLSGGFSLPKGGGMLYTTQLAAGIHYYICTPHITIGMKGMFRILGSSGIADPLLKLTSIFPNPAHDLIVVKTVTSLIGSIYSIIDATGKEVLSGKLESTESTIKISGLTNGVYFLRTRSKREELFTFIKN